MEYYRKDEWLIQQDSWKWANRIKLSPNAEWQLLDHPLPADEWLREGFVQIPEKEAEMLLDKWVRRIKERDKLMTEIEIKTRQIIDCLNVKNTLHLAYKFADEVLWRITDILEKIEPDTAISDDETWRFMMRTDVLIMFLKENNLLKDYEILLEYKEYLEALSKLYNMDFTRVLNKEIEWFEDFIEELNHKLGIIENRIRTIICRHIRMPGKEIFLKDLKGMFIDLKKAKPNFNWFRVIGFK